VLYEYLKRSFAAESRVKMIVDRRATDRRAAPCQESDDRRRHVRTRRIREGTISPLGDFTVVRFTPKVRLTPTPSELDQRPSLPIVRPIVPSLPPVNRRHSTSLIVR
jgi:hypothetical protein